MKCDLHRYFGEMMKSLPVEEKQKLAFSGKNFNDIPQHLETDQLVVMRSHRDYEGGSRVDRLSFFAQKPTYQQLGLLILSVVFRPGGSRVHIELAHASSTMKNLIAEYEGLTKRGFTYRTRPDHFLLLPAKVEMHPWTHQCLGPFDLPRFKLTNLKDCVVTEEDRANRDTVLGFGSDDASVKLAELLLRFGSPRNETNEIVLEGESGFRGVSRFSAEASFHLPGSSAWPTSSLF
jgi:hypothetical protein